MRGVTNSKSSTASSKHIKRKINSQTQCTTWTLWLYAIIICRLRGSLASRFQQNPNDLKTNAPECANHATNTTPATLMLHTADNSKLPEPIMHCKKHLQHINFAQMAGTESSPLAVNPHTATQRSHHPGNHYGAPLPFTHVPKNLLPHPQHYSLIPDLNSHFPLTW